MVPDVVQAVLIGIVAGYLSGQFGVGGGIITTPAIRLLLGRPELIAVGTPLPIIIPTALAGAYSYWRRGLVDRTVGLTAGVIGSGFAVLGAWATRLVGGRIVLLVTAVLILWVAADMALSARPERVERDARRTPPTSLRLRTAVLGVVAGLYSGFLGLGGGFVVVPALMRFFGFDIKRAIGTSLLVVAMLAIPGTVTHYLLGNIDVQLALGMAAGVVPGALLGAHVTQRAREVTVKRAFSAMLVLVGLTLALSELGVF